MLFIAACCVCILINYFFWLRQKLPSVNKELALKLMEEGDDEAELAYRKKKGKVRKPRFQKDTGTFVLVAVFLPDFQINLS